VSETPRKFRFDNATIEFAPGQEVATDSDGMEWKLSTVLSPGSCWTEVKKQVSETNELPNRADPWRIIEWLRDPNRKPPELAFTSGPERQIADAVAGELAKAREENAELKEAVFALRSLRGPDGHLLPSEVMETGLRMREPTHEEVAHLNNCASCRLRFDIYRSSVPPKDGKYPNLEAIAQGCISGAFREWPMVRPEVVGLFAELSELRAENARLAERVRVLEEAASAYLHRPAPAMNHEEALLASELRSRLEQALTTEDANDGQS
jgi:hypothetical protein